MSKRLIKYLTKNLKYAAYVPSKVWLFSFGRLHEDHARNKNVQCFLKPIGNLVVIYQAKYIAVCAGSIHVKVITHIQVFYCIQDFFF